MITKKEVAIKILRTKQMLEMKECVDCLFAEINILTECRHPNVVKILDASFDGTIVKEQLSDSNLKSEEYWDEEDEE
jgi:serine/threonine protein kinase